MSPVVSVVIPTYNHRAYVLDTLASVFAQTFTDYEVIVVNDGSPDDTAEVLRPLVEAGRIRYFEQPNQGQAAARNRGIAEARGEFIALLDDDDLWPPDSLANRVYVLGGHPACVLVYGVVEVLGHGAGSRWPNGNAPSGDVFQAFAADGWIYSPGQTLIRRSALDQVGCFDPTIWGTDDWDLYLRLAQVGRFQFIPELVFYYRIHASNSTKKWQRIYRNGLRVVNKHFGRTDTQDGRRLRVRAIEHARRFSGTFAAFAAIDHGMNGRWGEARRAWLGVARLQPSSFIRDRYWWPALRAFLPEEIVTVGKLARILAKGAKPPPVDARHLVDTPAGYGQ